MEEPQGACWGGSGCNVSTVYPPLPGRFTRCGLSLSIKTSPSLQRQERLQQARACLFGSRVTSLLLSRHMSRGVTRCSSVATQFTQTALQCLKCDLALGTSPLPLDTGARIVSEGGHYCHYGQLNHLTWCRVTYWWCSSWLVPTPSSQLCPAQCFLLCSFIGVLLSSPPLIPGLDVSQLFPTMHSSISAANRQAAANINKLRIKLKILSLSSNLRA